jgi:hypothetical protein
MRRRGSSPPKYQQRLLNLFREVEDQDLQEIMAEVVMVESSHRSSSRKNFPIQQIRDIVDAVARRQEETEQ